MAVFTPAQERRINELIAAAAPPKGPTGPTGATGPKGPTGPTGPSPPKAPTNVAVSTTAVTDT